MGAALEVCFTLFFVGDGLDVFVCFAERLVGKFGEGEGLAHVAHGAPVELLLLLVGEFHWRIYVDVAYEGHYAAVAVFVYEPGVSPVGLYGDGIVGELVGQCGDGAGQQQGDGK